METSRRSQLAGCSNEPVRAAETKWLFAFRARANSSEMKL
jgi:hypothetical protein